MILEIVAVETFAAFAISSIVTFFRFMASSISLYNVKNVRFNV